MDYKWIAQDKDGQIVKFSEEPFTDPNSWWNRLTPHQVVSDSHVKVENWKSSLINLETHDYKIEDGILKQVELQQGDKDVRAMKAHLQNINKSQPSTTTPCKYADVFIEAANDKTKVLQVKKGEVWMDVPVGQHEYRIKPENKVIKYRNYITKQGNVKAMNYDDDRDNDWMQWIGDWQNVEI